MRGSPKEVEGSPILATYSLESQSCAQFMSPAKFWIAILLNVTAMSLA